MMKNNNTYQSALRSLRTQARAHRIDTSKENVKLFLANLAAIHVQMQDDDKRRIKKYEN